MAWGLREERKRRRRQFRWSVFKWGLAFCVIAAAGVYAYQSGSRLAEAEVERLQREIASLSSTVAELERQNSEQQSAIAAERKRAEDWRQRYDKDVPAGEIKELFDLVQEKLSAGVAADRMRFVIGAAENQRECDEAPVTKRFLVKTPLYQGQDDSVGFADGAITVTAFGAPEKDASGNPEAWFDPAEPLTVRITHIGGKVSEFSGKLPLHPSVVLGDSEYRFTVVASSRGFVKVSGDKCKYP